MKKCVLADLSSGIKKNTFLFPSITPVNSFFVLSRTLMTFPSLFPLNGTILINTLSPFKAWFKLEG